jgi:chromate transporter
VIQPKDSATELAPSEGRTESTLGDLVGYFARLGTLGFGGPIALAGYMQRDLVESRRWITKEEYVEGLALAQLSPGPLAAQLAMYLGWVRAGPLGAAAVGIAFVAPSFLMVIGLAAVYLRYDGLPWMQGIFYGVGAAVIAIIARSAVKLAKLTLGSDRLLWAVCAVSGLATAVTGSEMVWLVLLSGTLVVLVRTRTVPEAVAGFPAFLFAGRHGIASGRDLAAIGWFFTKAGAFVFGSGLAIVPFLYDGAVRQYQWLDEAQFRDAVAVAMVTPGPVVITAGFVGFLAGGVAGSVLAAIGTFAPPYIIVVLAARWLRKPGPRLKAFVSGVTASAAGAIAGAAWVLGRRAIVDVPTAAIALATLGALYLVKRVPEPVLIGASAIAGLAVRGLGR